MSEPINVHEMLEGRAARKLGLQEVPVMVADGMTDARRIQIGGDHYVAKAIQPWDAMRAWMSDEAFCGYLQGNVIKYIARYRDKGGVEDLRKAAHYLQRLIEEEEHLCRD